MPVGEETGAAVAVAPVGDEPLAPTPPAREVSVGRKTVLQRIEPIIFSAPAVVFMVLFFAIPIARMVFLGLTVEADDGSLSFSMSHWLSVFEDDYGRSVLFRTLRVAIFTTLGCLILAYPLALWVRQISPRWRSAIILISLSPLLTSSVVRMLGWNLFLQNNGLLNEFLGLFGLGPFRLLYRESSIVIGAVHVFFGFMFLTLLSSMTRIKDSEINAAMGLGATRMRVIREVVIPLTLPGIIGGSVIVFSLACSEYAIAAMLGGSSQPVMGTEIYKQALVLVRWDRGAGIATVLFVVVIVVIVGVMRPLRKRASRGLTNG